MIDNNVELRANMKVFYNKIKSLVLNGRVKESNHFKNIRNGETLTIDGKKFIKVKLKFVDTLDYQTSKIIDNLETEIKLLNEKNEKLTEEIASAETKSLLLQIYNTNLLNGERTKSARLTTEIKKLKAPNDRLIQAIKDLENKVENQAQHITGLEKINQQLKQKIKEKSYNYEKPEHKVNHLTPHNQTEENSRKMRKRHDGKINDLLKEINSLKNRLLQQEKLNENLLNKYLQKNNRTEFS